MTDFWVRVSLESDWVQVPTLRDVVLLFTFGYDVRLG